MSPLPALAAVSILVIVIPALLVLGSFLRSQDASSKSLKAADLQCAHWSTQRLCQISGVPVSDGRLLELLPPAAEGHSLEAISVALRSLGLVCEGYRESWADLVENGPPAIAHLSHPNHFVVVCGIDSDLRAVHVYDGDGARTRVRREDFEKRWTGAVLRVVDHAQGMTEQNVRFERLLVDKGDIAATGAVEVFEFPFTNVSSEPLRIDSVTPSCSCVGVDKPDGSLGPGEASVIRLKYKVAPAAGPFMQSALVTTSGGSHCRLMISASGYSGASFSVIPASIEGAKLIRGRDNSFSLFLHNAGRWTDTRVRGVTGTISNAVITGYKVHSETRDERNRYSGGIGVANETQRLEVFVRPSDGPAVTALGRLAIETNVPRHERVTRLFPVPHACGFLLNCRRKEPVIIDRYEVVFGGCFAVAKQPAVPRRAQSRTPSNARHPSNACGRVVGRPILHTERSPWSVWWTCSLVPTARKMRYRYSPGSSRVGQSHLPARSRKTQLSIARSMAPPHRSSG